MGASARSHSCLAVGSVPEVKDKFVRRIGENVGAILKRNKGF